MDADEFKSRFLPCQTKLYRLAFKLTGNTQDAEDMVQETYLRLWRQRNSIIELNNPAAFCMTTLKNVCFDNFRRKNPDENDSPPEELPIDDGHDLAHDMEMLDNAEKIKMLIERLPEPQKSIIRMRDICDLQYDEIETATGLTEGNIRVLLSRARKKIRVQFNQIMNYERK